MTKIKNNKEINRVTKANIESSTFWKKNTNKTNDKVFNEILKLLSSFGNKLIKKIIVIIFTGEKKFKANK